MGVGGAKFAPTPNPAVADARSGWREYGSMDLAGRSLALARRAGGYTLSSQDASLRFKNRATTFAAFDNGRGWYPAP